MPSPRGGPAERVRARVAALTNPELARRLPAGYQRLGRVLLLRLPEELRPHFLEIGEAWQKELGVATVLRWNGEVGGEFRTPHLETVVGHDTETEVVEHGVRFRFDAAQILFARGNRTERHRAGLLTRPGETVVDLFAGIGYFALPASVRGGAGRVWAVEKNPRAFRYLEQNIRVNRVSDRVRPVLGDNRAVDIPPDSADRVFLGILPSAAPWIPRALELARSQQATLHAHLVVGSRDGRNEAESTVRHAVERAGRSVLALGSRKVKSYGPGREHVVVDVTCGTPGPEGTGVAS